SVSVLPVGGTETLIADTGSKGGLLATAASAGFQRVSLDLSAFAGQQVQIRFRFHSDFSVVFEGWYLDDVSLIATTPGTRVVTLNPGQIVPGLDFANQNGARIRGTVLNDADGSGSRQAGEPGMAGVTVFVDLNGNGVANSGEPSAVTAAD